MYSPEEPNRTGSQREAEDHRSDQPGRAFAEALQQGAEQRVDGAGGADHRQHAADDEQEEDDVAGRGEGARDGREQGQRTHQFALFGYLERARHHHGPALLVQFGLKRTLRNDPGRDQRRHHQEKKQRERIWDFKAHQ